MPLLAYFAIVALLAGCQSDQGSGGSATLVLPTPVSVGLTTAKRRVFGTVHPRRVHFDPTNDDRLLVMERGGDIQIWNLPPSWTIDPASPKRTGAVGASSEAELSVTIPAEAIDARFSAAGAAIFVGDGNGAVSLWRPDGQRLWIRQTDGSAIRTVETRGDLLAGGDDRGEIVVWRHDASVAYRRPLAHDGPVMSLAFSPAGDVLLSEGADTLLRGWRVPDGGRGLVELALYRPPDGRLRAMLPSLIRLDVQWGWDRAVAFIPGHEAFVSSTFDGALHIQRVDREVIGAQDDAHDGHHIRAIAVSPDGSTIATGGFNTELRLWSVPGLAGPTVIKGHHRVVTGVAFDRTGRVASASIDGTVHVWSSDGKRLGTLPHNRPPSRRHGAGPRRRRVPPNTPIAKPHVGGLGPGVAGSSK